MTQQKNIIRPLVALRGTIILPGLSTQIVATRNKSVGAVKASEGETLEVIFVAQKNQTIEDPKEDEIFHVGTLAYIRQISSMPDGSLKLQAEGIKRVKINRFIKNDSYFIVEASEIPEILVNNPEIEALRRAVLAQFQQLVMGGKNLPLEAVIPIMNLNNPHRLAEMIVFTLDVSLETKQKILEIEDLKEKLEEVSRFLAKEFEIVEVSKKIQDKTQEEMSKMQKEVFLREQLKTIQKELGEEEGNEFALLKKSIEEAGMPEDVKKQALKELSRLEKMPSFAPEVSYIRTYLDWLTALPWGKKSENKIDVKNAAKILEDEHHGLEKIKERILDYLAVQKIAGKIRGPILCFVGPPGVGKTSIGKSIAKALGRKFVRISLGGVRDEAEIRGHRRTYVGALPGRIIQGIKNAGEKNPVFMLDELDKVGTDFRGDPSSALLEALDPEQNFSFSDHYLEVPFDLSDVLFVATANILDTIPPALRDRLEIIPFAGYTEDEKLHIAKDFLAKKQLEAHGLNSKILKFSDDSLRALIRYYTREAGVRNLEREIATICRKIARKIAESNKKNYLVTERALKNFLGPVKFLTQEKEKKDEIGVVTGLAVTEAGGEILSIEATKMPGKGQLVLTGQLGDVMKESAQAAMSFCRARAGKTKSKNDIFKDYDWHIHVPAGAVPKDGPSAGVAITMAIYSVMAGAPVRSDVAMTGEVTLRGRVLPIGGVKEKVLAAHRAGIREIILPAENEKDIEEIPPKVRSDIKIHFAKNIEEVLEWAMRKVKNQNAKVKSKS